MSIKFLVLGEGGGYFGFFFLGGGVPILLDSQLLPAYQRDLDKLELPTNMWLKPSLPASLEKEASAQA